MPTFRKFKGSGCAPGGASISKLNRHLFAGAAASGQRRSSSRSITWDFLVANSCIWQRVPPRSLSPRGIVGFPAGSGPDIAVRLMGQWLSERLGQQVVVEDRPGAGGTIATEAVVRAAPDGYSLLCATAANAVNATLYENLKFDFVRDIAPVASHW
jgi:tripartite-type tricarboxylate transporter receptor subunit TctC